MSERDRLPRPGPRPAKTLDEEIIRSGEQVNPLSVRQAALAQLSGEQMARFEREIERIDALRAQTRTRDPRRDRPVF